MLLQDFQSPCRRRSRCLPAQAESFAFIVKPYLTNDMAEGVINCKEITAQLLLRYDIFLKS
jgi:hypothetical protein